MAYFDAHQKGSVNDRANRQFRVPLTDEKQVVPMKIGCMANSNRNSDPFSHILILQDLTPNKRIQEKHVLLSNLVLLHAVTNH